MDLRFDDKTVVVTGAAGGFGAAIARTFSAAGANVVVSDINIDAAEQVASELSSAFAIRTDVTKEADMIALIRAAESRWGSIDVMVNNAGVPHRQKPLIEMDTADVDWQFDINIRSVFLGCKYAALSMQATGGGVIVNTASIAGLRPRPGLTIYNATKGAVITLTRGLATELGPQIRVNAVNPLASPTGFIHSALGVDSLDEPAAAAMTANVPMARMADPQDIANAVTFLASDRAAFLTGVCLDVDGGRSIQ